MVTTIWAFQISPIGGSAGLLWLPGGIEANFKSFFVCERVDA